MVCRTSRMPSGGCMAARTRTELGGEGACGTPASLPGPLDAPCEAARQALLHAAGDRLRVVGAAGQSCGAARGPATRRVLRPALHRDHRAGARAASRPRSRRWRRDHRRPPRPSARPPPPPTSDRADAASVPVPRRGARPSSDPRPCPTPPRTATGPVGHLARSRGHPASPSAVTGPRSPVGFAEPTTHRGHRPRPPRTVGVRHRGPSERVPDRRIRRKRVVEALQGLVVPAVPRIRPGKPGEVPTRCLVAAGALGVSLLDVRHEQSERPHVLLVVDHHAGEGLDGSATQYLEVDRRDLPALDVAHARDTEQLAFDGAQAGVLHAMPEHAAHERQQVEVAGVDRRRLAGHPVPGLEERPVEAAPVVGHEPCVRRDPARDLLEQRRLVRVIREQQLDLPEGVAVPARQARRGRRASRRPSRDRWSPCRGRRAGRPPAAGRAGGQGDRGRAGWRSARPRVAR